MASSSSSSSFTFKPLHQTYLQLLSFTHCKYSSTLNTFKFHDSFNGPPFPPTHQRFSPLLQVKAHVANLEAKLESNNAHQELSRNSKISKASYENNSGVSSLKDNFDVVDENIEKRVILRDRFSKTGLNPKGRRRKGSSVRSKDGNFVEKTGESKGYGKGGKKMWEEKTRKSSKKTKVETPEWMLRVGLDMCSKRGDVMGGILLYDLARKEGIKMGQYHYAVLLYLCSSAATGVVQPAKSGSGNRSLNHAGLAKGVSGMASEDLAEFDTTREADISSNESDMEHTDQDLVMIASDEEGSNVNGFPAGIEYDSHIGYSNGFMDPVPQSLDEMVQLMKSNADNSRVKGREGEKESLGIKVSEDIKRYAMKRGFEIYDSLRLEKVPMNEATFTSVARMAMSLGDGDMALDVVNQMKELGINPRLRSYGPALSVFCSNGDVEKAFTVEQHMLEHCVYPEEPELEALLRVSVEAGRSDKVYYLLHKLRTSVRQVSPSTADLIEKWFKSKFASRIGKRKWDERLVKEAIENGGGGWHGKGWLGKGKWTVSRTSMGSDGFCQCCGEKLAIIDLDPVETENFARSVASIATKRERDSSFQKFQKWLDYYGPFEAVVDAANVGLYSQRKFKPSKVNAVVNGIRQMLPSRKWPLIVLHNRRITGDKMEEPFNKGLIEKWKNADALYATPTGSNDDWYWLYAAIKFKSLIVTNDEMRDHLFQLLGDDFFPKWKERHQVRFSFSETGPVFHMPPPCSIVIQETEKGHWHIPIVSDSEAHGERTWLCITRSPSLVTGLNSSNIHEEVQLARAKPDVIRKTQVKPVSEDHDIHGDNKQSPQEIYKSLKNILDSSLLSDHRSILPEIEAAEELGGCTIDFQI